MKTTTKIIRIGMLWAFAMLLQDIFATTNVTTTVRERKKETKINMALAIDIEDLLNKQKIESSRIEFKKGWNPAKKSRGQVLVF